MATIRKRGDSYQIRVSDGYDAKGNHKEQSMTLNVYSHMFRNAQAKVAEAMNGAFEFLTNKK